MFPLLLNLVVRTFGWIALLAQNGLVNQAMIALGLVHAPVKLLFNFAGLLIGLTHIFLPFMVLVLVGAIQNIPRDVEDAARVLGASWAGAFVRVTLPLSLPGVLSGSILVFVLTISALVTPRLLGGPTYQVMSTLIYDEFLQRLNWPAGSAQALLLTADGARARLPVAASSPGGRERACERGPCARVAPASVGDARLRLPPAARRRRGARVVQPHVVSHRAAARRDAALVRRGAGRPRVRSRHRLERGARRRGDHRLAHGGRGGSYALIRRRVRGGALVSALLNAPLIFPGVVVGVALLQFYALVD